MRRYLLISVFDRTIFTHLFDTLKGAQKAMHEEMALTSDVPEEIFEHSKYYDPSGEYGFGDFAAYSMTNHDDFDWQIIDLEEENKQPWDKWIELQAYQKKRLNMANITSPDLEEENKQP